MGEELKLTDGKGELTIVDQIKMHAAQIQQNAVGYVVVAGVTAVLVFLVTGFIDVSNAVSLVRGRTESVDQTVQLLLQQKSEAFDALLQANQMLTQENIELHQQLGSVKK